MSSSVVNLADEPRGRRDAEAGGSVQRIHKCWVPLEKGLWSTLSRTPGRLRRDEFATRQLCGSGNTMFAEALISVRGIIFDLEFTVDAGKRLASGFILVYVDHSPSVRRPKIKENRRNARYARQKPLMVLKLSRLRGCSLRGLSDSCLTEWAALHRAELMKDCISVRSEAQFKPIAPSK